jgi:hypothetical protein
MPPLTRPLQPSPIVTRWLRAVRAVISCQLRTFRDPVCSSPLVLRRAWDNSSTQTLSVRDFSFGAYNSETDSAYFPLVLNCKFCARKGGNALDRAIFHLAVLPAS